MEEMLRYFRANTRVAGYNSPIQRVAITLTFIKGKEVLDGHMTWEGVIASYRRFKVVAFGKKRRYNVTATCAE